MSKEENIESKISSSLSENEKEKIISKWIQQIAPKLNDEG
jgi:hypothetical protein